VNESAIQLMFASIKQLGDKILDLSDRMVTHGTTLLQLNLSENDSTLELKTIPLVETYKYTNALECRYPII